jgi:hypothetical protein
MAARKDSHRGTETQRRMKKFVDISSLSTLRLCASVAVLVL